MPRPTSKIWDYFELINTDGKKTARCNYCRKHFGTNATKLRNHFMSVCKQCPEDAKMDLLDKLRTETSQATIYSLSMPSPVASTSTQLHGPMIPVPTSSPSGNNSLSSCPFSQESSFNQQSENFKTPDKKKEIDLRLGRATYATGTTFNLLESSFGQKSITALQTQSVPSRNKISNSLLDIEYERILKETSDIINQAEDLALVLDGWSEINGKGTVNIIITTPKPFFYKCVYPVTNRDTSTYLFTQLKAITDEIDPSKFVAVVTDNTNNMKAMWRMVELEYAHMFAVGCASHTLNLLLNDIMKLENFKICIEMVTKIIKYMKKRHVELAYFEKNQNQMYGNSKKTLKLPSQTPCGGYVIMMESFLCNREALEATVVCLNLNFDREIKQNLLADDLWNKVTAYQNILKPMFVATTKLESDGAVLSEVPQMFEYVRENVCNTLSSCEIINEEEKRYIKEAIGKRQHCVEKPIHFAANILDPRHRGIKLSPEKVAKGQELIHKYANLLNKNTGKVMANLAEYQAKCGFYSQAGIWTAADQIEARTWWKGLCNCQIISSIAIKLLSVPPSSVSSERNGSLFGNTLTRPRNMINTDRLQKLIIVRSNIRQLSDNPNDNVYLVDEEECSSTKEEENEKETGHPEQEIGLQDFILESDASDGSDPLI